MGQFSFPKIERLCSEKLISELFIKGQPYLSYPIKLTCLFTNFADILPVKVLIIVSRKRFKKSIQRNRLKRLLREVYRLNKNILYQWLIVNNKKCLLAISYIGDHELSFKEIELAFNKALKQIFTNELKNTESDMK